MDASRARRRYSWSVLFLQAVFLVVFIVSTAIGDNFHAIICAIIAFSIGWVACRDLRRYGKLLDKNSD
jgi:hypothetical protein